MGQVDSIRQTGVAGPGRGRGQPMQPPVAAGESLVYCLSRASVEKVRIDGMASAGACRWSAS